MFKILTKRIKRMKIELFVATIIVLMGLFATSIYPAEKFTNTLGEYQNSLSKEKGTNKPSFDFQSAVGVSGSFYTMVVGCKASQCPTELKAGIIDYTNGAIAYTYSQPPASGAYYFADLGSRLNLVKPAYAQTPQLGGTGFSVLQPFLGFWRASRNITYFLFVIFTLVLGIMVMLRQKISPQAVMTVQAALPRMIVALLMVTFSYAIVGLMVDLMYVLFGLLVYGIGAGAGGNLTDYDAGRYFNQFSSAGFGAMFGHVFTRGISSTGDLLWGLGSNLSVAVGGGILGGLATLALASVSGLGEAVAISLVPLLLGLAITFIAFLIRILFALAKAYLMLIIHLVFAPFFILWSALTGAGIYGGWLKGVLSNLFVFFAVGVIIYLSDVLIKQFPIDQPLAAGLWGPPYLGNNGAILKAMIGFASIVLIAQMPDIVNQIFNIRGPQFQMPGVGRQIESFTGSTQQNASRIIAGRAAAGSRIFRWPF